MFNKRTPYPSQAELDAERAQGGAIPVDDLPPPEMQPAPGQGDLPLNLRGQLVPRDPEIKQQPYMPDEPTDKVDLFKGEAIAEKDAPVSEVQRRRHAILMASLEEEGERQVEERLQAQTDDDYYHHQQWKADEARVLAARGQAPLVFNESRGAIDWMCGTERKLRKDYKIRPRSREDEQNAEVKTKVFKYTEDVNMAPWHRSRAFKQMAVSGLGWLEEGINCDPEKELILRGLRGLAPHLPRQPRPRVRPARTGATCTGARFWTWTTPWP
jgi:hypothetical protein